MTKITDMTKILFNDNRDNFVKRSLNEMDKRKNYYIKNENSVNKKLTKELLIEGINNKRFAHFIIPGIPNRTLNELKKSFDDIGGCRFEFSKIVRGNQYWIIQLPKTTSGYEVDVILLIRFFTKMYIDGIIDNYPCGFHNLEFTVDELIKAEYIYSSIFNCGHILQCVKSGIIFNSFYPLSSRQYPNTITCLLPEYATKKRIEREAKTIHDITIVQSFVRRWLIKK